MRILSRLLALSAALTLGLSAGLAQDAPSLDQKVQEACTRMERGGLASVWDRSVELEQLGSDAAPILAKKLEGASGPVKLGVAKALFALKAGDQKAMAVTAVKDVLKGDGSRDEKIAAADLLTLYGSREDVKPLEKSLDTFTDPYVKLAVLKGLKKRGRVVKAKDLMVELLASDDFGVRAEAALRLAECDDVDSGRAILETLKAEPSERGRRAAALLEQDELAKQQEKTGGLADKDEIVKLKEKKIQELEEQKKKLEDDLAKAAEKGSGTGGPAIGPGWPLLKELEDKIGKFYVDEKKTSVNDLTRSAAKGMVDSLDPFSQYMDETESADFKQTMAQEYAGIGAVVQTNVKTGFLNIVRPIYGGPAYKAGIRTLDQIVEVNGETTKGLLVNDLVKKLKGKPDTPVTIKVKKFMAGPEAAPVEMTIKRRAVTLASVRFDMLPGKIGYLQLESFGAKASDEIEAALNELEKLGMRALVFDLRGNPGGYLNQAVEVCSKFLAKGKLVVYQQGRDGAEIGKRRDFLVQDNDQHPDYPLVLLVDENSASASEIVSGCLQVHKRADLVGQRTFGKGSVQQIFPVTATEGKSALRLTIAYYYLPDGRCIHKPRNPVTWRYQEFLRSEIERWKMEGNITEAQAKILLDQYKQPPGGVVPDFAVKLETLSPDVQKKWAAIADAGGKLEEYIQKHWTKDWDSNPFKSLVAWDNFDSSKYPDFDAFYTELKTDLSKDDLRKLMRIEVRRFAQDELAKILPSDFQEDQQLDAGVWVAYQKLGADLKKESELQFISKKFPEGIARNPDPIAGKKGVPDSAEDESGEEGGSSETPKKDDSKKGDKKNDKKKNEPKKDDDKKKDEPKKDEKKDDF
jgi:carboxyl-terminal processing protease